MLPIESYNLSTFARERLPGQMEILGRMISSAKRTNEQTPKTYSHCSWNDSR